MFAVVFGVGYCSGCKVGALGRPQWSSTKTYTGEKSQTLNMSRCNVKRTDNAELGGGSSLHGAPGT